MIVNESITGSAVKLAVNVDDNTPDKQVLSLLAGTCEAYVANQTTASRFQLVVGRLLCVVRERKLFKEQYKTFDRYMLAEVIDKYGISRATVWTGLQIAQTLPDVPVEEATRIGVVKMRDIARAIKHEEDKFTHANDKPKLTAKLIGMASKSTAQDFRKALEQGNLLTPRSSPQRQNVIVVRGTPELVTQWEEFVGERTPEVALAELLARVRRPATRKQAA